nr:DUF4394 domain-containing protein [Kovacikia minuta]
MANPSINSFNVESGCYPSSISKSGSRTVLSDLIPNNSVDSIYSALTGRSSFQEEFVGSEGEINVSKLTRFLKQIGISTDSGKLSQLIDKIVDRFNPHSPAPNPATAEFVGVTSNHTLAFFNSGDLDNVTKVKVTGLQRHEKLLGVDFRPNTGDLFAVGSSNRLYTIDYTTGKATQVGDPFAVALSAQKFWG